jgi:tripartite-type tricarboxylate transporter receptor subunit TctC
MEDAEPLADVPGSVFPIASVRTVGCKADSFREPVVFRYVVPARQCADLLRGSIIMQCRRREFLHFVTGTLAFSASLRIARSESYPARPVRIVIGYPSGTAPSIVGHLIGQWLSERLSRQFIIDCRPGAASNIGTEIVAKAAPDGYTLLIAVATNVINATLYNHLGFNFVRDLAPVASIGTTPFVIVINPQVPVKSVPELIAYAKVNSGKINVATSGVGTTPHVASELFQIMTGISLVHVPYRGNYMSDLLSAQVPLSFAPIGTVIEFIRDGRLRALAVTTAMRSTALPEVPAVAEFVPAYEATGWYGICAPMGTPAGIIEELNAATSAGVSDANLNSRLLNLGIEPRAMTASEFTKFVAEETEKWGKVIRAAKIMAE